MWHIGEDAGPGLHRHARARPGDASCPRWPARSARRTASRWPTPMSSSPAPCPTSRAAEPAAAGRPGESDLSRKAPPGAAAQEALSGSRPEFRHRRWRRRDRRHHLLHQHLQPVGADRRRPARPQGARARPDRQAVGEDLAGAGIAGGHRLPREGRPDGRSRRARLQPRRLWLHHLHRQFRPAAGGNLRSDQRERPRRLLGALRQPQLRRPRQPGRARELPRLAAAGRRLCARRLDARQPRDRAARPGQGRQGRLPQGHLADLEGDRRTHPHLDQRADVPQPLCRRLQGRCGLAEDRGRRRRDLWLEGHAPPMCRTRPISRA